MAEPRNWRWLASVAGHLAIVRLINVLFGGVFSVGRRRLALLVGAALMAGGYVGAQGPVAGVAAIHLQAVPADLGGALETSVRFPPPEGGMWEAVTAESDAACLGPLGVDRPEPGTAGTLSLVVRGADGSGLEPGESCGGVVNLRFISGDESREVLVVAAFHRPAAPPYPFDDLQTSYSADRIPLPSGADVLGTLVELRIQNTGVESLTVIGLAGLESLRETLGDAYLFEAEGRPANLDGLEPLAGPVNASLAPGEVVRIGIVVDPSGSLPPDRSIVAVQPAVIVERGGERFSLRFGLVTTAKGVDLP